MGYALNGTPGWTPSGPFISGDGIPMDLMMGTPHYTPYPRLCPLETIQWLYAYPLIRWTHGPHPPCQETDPMYRPLIPYPSP